MTKLLTPKILLILLMSFFSTAAIAHDIEIKNADGVTIYYNWVNNKTELEVSYRGENSGSYEEEYSGNLAIPETVTYNGKTFSVSSIGDYSFWGCDGLTSITIPNSVTSIGYGAFYGCSGLTSITIPNSVTSIGGSIYIIDNPFRHCINLVSLIVESGNPVYDSRNNCNAIIESASNKLTVGCKNTIIPNTVQRIDGEAFSGCSSLQSVTIPNSVNGIGDEAFMECTNLKSVIIPNSVTYIGRLAFAGCSSLTSIIIPSSVTYLDDVAFNDCSGLTSIIVEAGNPKYDSRNNCNAIIETASNTLITGSNNTIIPNSVSSIRRVAFWGCKSLTSITIPNSVTSIGRNAFSGCSGLSSIVSEIEKPFEIDECFDNDTYTNVELIVPKGTKAAYQATEGWNKFNNIVEAEDQGSQANEVFSVDGISYKIVDGNSVAVTNSGVYYTENIDIPSQVRYNGNTYNVTSIEAGAFSGCTQLPSITIPNSISSIGNLAFYFCGLLHIVSEIENPFAIDESVFETEMNEIYEDATLIVPVGAKAKYQATDGWKRFRKIREEFSVDGICYKIEDGTSVSVTDPYRWYYTDNVDIPSQVRCKDVTYNVTSIGPFAFSNCSGLTSVTIPNSILSIGNEAFLGCVSLRSIVSEIENPFAIEESVFETGQDLIYEDATLTVPAGTKAKYQATDGWKRFRKIVEVAGAEIEFSIDGVTYHGSSSDQTALVKSVDTSMSILEIPASVSYEGAHYQVSGIDEHAFDGSTMAALVWNVDVSLPSNAFKNASIGSNFLLYVKSESYAPSSVKNVVINGTAQSIVLSDDGGQFCCPQAFMAEKISYTHNYSMETGGDGKGWETIALPFNVQKISHGTRGEIVPFAFYSSGSSQKPFWLASMSSSGFSRSSVIQANQPYIIAMPNSNKYQNDYNLAGDVTFSAENVSVPATPTFSGTFLPAYSTVAKSASVYALNVKNRYVSYSGNYDAGSRFISNLRDVRPFEAYISGSSSTRGVIEIDFDDDKTGLDNILFSTDENSEVTIYTISGRKVGTSLNGRLDETIEQLPKGVYIVNGRKIVK